MNNLNTVRRNNLNDLSDLDDDSDNELPLSSISNFGHPINNLNFVRNAVKEYKTADCQTKQKVNQDNKLPNPSRTNFIHPIYDNKIIKHGSGEYNAVDYQIEQDIDQDNELPLSSIADFLHPFDKKLIEGGAVDSQPNDNINHYNKSEPNKFIYNKEQSIIENLSKTYTCDICGKIFPKRTDIIKHFKTSLCYPDVIYIYESF
ncbi:hypothetical protein QTP88_007205 [Uroleucon formosanum]